MSNRRHPKAPPRQVDAEELALARLDASRVAADALADAGPQEAVQILAHVILGTWAFGSRWTGDEQDAIWRSLQHNSAVGLAIAKAVSAR